MVYSQMGTIPWGGLLRTRSTGAYIGAILGSYWSHIGIVEEKNGNYYTPPN